MNVRAGPPSTPFRSGAAPTSSVIARRSLPVIVAIVLIAAGIGILTIPRGTTEAGPALVGTLFRPIPASPIRLTDQFGHQVSLSQFRGHPAIVTFLSAACTTLCPVVAETIHRSVEELGTPGRRVEILAVSTDPTHDTPALIRTFSSRHGLYYRWHYLTGSRSQLAPIWHAYYVYVAPANASQSLRDAHTSATYLIDSQGRKRVVMGGDPRTDDLQHNLQILLGIPVKPVGAYAIPAPQVGHPAPQFALRDLNGRMVSLRSLRGKVVLLNFWASWCPPCRQEAPRLSRWYEHLKSKNFVVVGVDQEEGRSDVLSFVRSFRLRYPIVLDGDGSVDASYDASALPKSLLIDPQGLVRSVVLGAVQDSFFRSRVTPLLAGDKT